MELFGLTSGCYPLGMAEPDPSFCQAKALAAQAWAEVCELVDLQLSPLGLRAMEALAPKSGELIVDLGCGAGQTVVQLADLVGPDGRVIGVDIAALLLNLALSRAVSLAQVSFVEGDAQAPRSDRPQPASAEISCH